MGEPVWMAYVQWPKCDECRATGVAIDEKTKWPVECSRCKAGRKNAIKKAQTERRKAVRRGDDA